jgi:hypothetical protein
MHLRAVCGKRRAPPPGRARLEVKVYRWSLQDPDNAQASLKQLIDALVKEGWLADDSPRHLGLALSEEVDREWQRTEITWMPESPGTAGPRRQT